MTKLKIHLNTDHGHCQCFMEVPHACLGMVGEDRLKKALWNAYESLGAEVVSVSRVEELAHEM